MGNTKHMQDHFSKVASDYRKVRTTDLEPIQFIADSLKGLSKIEAADIGCGAGRYDLLLFRHLKNLHLTCIDNNELMLKETEDYLRSHGISNFRTIKADADNISLEDNSMDCILTFNAVHHFNFPKFLKKCAQIIKESGKIFIYTRLRSQNARNIWGQHFPHFLERENRLYELNEVKQWIKAVRLLTLENVKFFQYKRNAFPEELFDKARAKHYSTFALYKEEELEESLKTFQENIKKKYPNMDDIEWSDENILLVLAPISKPQ